MTELNELFLFPEYFEEIRFSRSDNSDIESLISNDNIYFYEYNISLILFIMYIPLFFSQIIISLVYMTNLISVLLIINAFIQIFTLYGFYKSVSDIKTDYYKSILVMFYSIFSINFVSIITQNILFTKINIKYFPLYITDFVYLIYGYLTQLIILSILSYHYYKYYSIKQKHEKILL